MDDLQVMDITEEELKKTSGGWIWVARGVAVWAITQVIDGVIDGLERPC